MCVKLGNAKFQPSSARRTISNWGLSEEKVEKSVRFSTENWPYLRNGERYVAAKPDRSGGRALRIILLQIVC